MLLLALAAAATRGQLPRSITSGTSSGTGIDLVAYRSLRAATNGDLILDTPGGLLTHKKPRAFQGARTVEAGDRLLPGEGAVSSLRRFAIVSPLIGGARRPVSVSARRPAAGPLHRGQDRGGHRRLLECFQHHPRPSREYPAIRMPPINQARGPVTMSIFSRPPATWVEFLDRKRD